MVFHNRSLITITQCYQSDVPFQCNTFHKYNALSFPHQGHYWGIPDFREWVRNTVAGPLLRKSFKMRSLEMGFPAF